MIVVASGYFNPLHSGHIRYLQAAKALGGCLIVVVNNDEQVKLKGMLFMSAEERAAIISAIGCVSRVMISVDTDNTINKTLTILHPDIFAKGGDSIPENTPEVGLCKELGIKVVFGVGGEKIQSSRWLKSGVISKSC